MNENIILNGLSPEQLTAAQLITTLLNCFNGQGGLEGVARYTTLEGRVRLAAARSRDLGSFYSTLARSLRLPQPSAEQQAELLPLIANGAEAASVLRCLALQTPYVVMLARELHTSTREVRKANRDAKKTTPQMETPT